MKVFHSIKDLRSSVSTAVTIGNFDGVHLGHQALLKRLNEVSPRRVVLTFSNHPNEILHRSPISYLTTLPHRLALLEALGVSDVILIPFTEHLSKQTAEQFLTQLKEELPFSHLILGYDAVIGNDRQKDLSHLSHQLSFTLEYLKPIQVNSTIVSSSEIRRSIQQGKLTETSLFLGRPYSIYATVQHGERKGGALGFHTANLPVSELALPPLGVYAAHVIHQGKTYQAVANLGHAPTLHHNRPITLEVHLLNTNQQLYGQAIEVCFCHFIRPEQCFANPDQLKAQITKDIDHALKIL
jgi:riboflavin kinase / FMN adenylyltransferase